MYVQLSKQVPKYLCFQKFPNLTKNPNFKKKTQVEKNVLKNLKSVKGNTRKLEKILRVPILHNRGVERVKKVNELEKRKVC